MVSVCVCLCLGDDPAELIPRGSDRNGVHAIDAFFSVSSVMTTTGYATVDFNLWPTYSRIILVTIMFTGACAGSTGGGIKISRFVIYIKAVSKELRRLAHPAVCGICGSTARRWMML